MKTIFVTLLLLTNVVLFAQSNKKLNDNVRTEMIYSDSTSAYFVIWIEDEIKLNKHEKHSEKLLVIEHENELLLKKLIEEPTAAVNSVQSYSRLAEPTVAARKISAYTYPNITSLNKDSKSVRPFSCFHIF